MSDSQTYVWPKEYPIDVPSKDAKPAVGYVYRLVSQVPPTQDDFKITRLDNTNRKFKKIEISGSYGLSLWSTLESMIRAKKRYFYAEQYGNKKIVGGELCPTLGVIVKNTDDHVTLWKQDGAEPHRHICEEAL
ncbi:hypothetical protein [Moritella sp.]|uniref:hypothetical protein n=1 Tax=Moritella sp. TaxID=78556 RepID=UPI0025F9870F|nr:hypothetical protein [Moritella sp.]MCJ8348270.1 hypothetical protein [Moritella sp.]